MWVTRQLSTHHREDAVVEPDNRGAVAWALFNRHYSRLQTTRWSEINHGRAYPWHLRWVRLVMAWAIQRNDAILDLRSKARIIARMPIPRDPDIVYFGAEAGWEAALVQALFGDGGRVVLIDNDEAAYQRFLGAPRELGVRAPRGFGTGELIVRRDPQRFEYIRQDFFSWQQDRSFDVGIDWGLIEHFPAARKLALMRAMQAFLRDDGVQISAVPRNTPGTRLFYWAFRDELNFGYRELMSPREHRAVLTRGGYEVLRTFAHPSTCIACARPRDLAVRVAMSP